MKIYLKSACITGFSLLTVKIFDNAVVPQTAQSATSRKSLAKIRQKCIKGFEFTKNSTKWKIAA
jgi:hypothetical protein